MKKPDRMELYRQGLNDSAIADKIGLTQEAVSRWRRNQGLPPNKKRRHLKDNRLELYEQGLSDEEIARIIGVKTHAITGWRSRRGIGPNKVYADELTREPRIEPKTGYKPRGLSLKNISDNRMALYELGFPDAAIASETGLTVKGVISWRMRNRLSANKVRRKTKMKKIIGGRRYDTTTAELVGEASYSHRRDFNYWFEELYRKKTGEFFLYGEGGPNSKYSRTIGLNEWSGGEEIRPLTLEEAQEWAEEYLDGDEYETIFGEVEEDKEQMSTWLLATVKAEGDKLREEKDLTWADIVEAGIKTLR